MSENITHMAVFEDSSRLALHSPHVCTAFKETLKKHWEVARHGSVTVSGDNSTVHVLNVTRSKWKTRRPEDHIDERLAAMAPTSVVIQKHAALTRRLVAEVREKFNG